MRLSQQLFLQRLSAAQVFLCCQQMLCRRLRKKKTSETHPQSLVLSPSRADGPVRRAGVLLMRHQHALPRCRCLCSITLNLRSKMGSFLEILNHAESVEHTLQDTIVDF